MEPTTILTSIKTTFYTREPEPIRRNSMLKLLSLASALAALTLSSCSYDKWMEMRQWEEQSYRKMWDATMSELPPSPTFNKGREF